MVCDNRHICLPLGRWVYDRLSMYTDALLYAPHQCNFQSWTFSIIRASVSISCAANLCTLTRCSLFSVVLPYPHFRSSDHYCMKSVLPCSNAMTCTLLQHSPLCTDGSPSSYHVTNSIPRATYNYGSHTYCTIHNGAG